jgi:hypothetical protein
LWIEHVFGLTPRRMPEHVVAVDESHLRYGRFVNGSGRRELLDYREIPLPGDFWLEGPMGGPARDEEALSASFDELLDALSLPPERVSLLVPDAWLRLSFAELEALPSGAAQRQEVVRWKLRTLVPFRVEDLRVKAIDIAPLPRQQEAHRLLIGFSLERLLAQLEGLLEQRGARVGQIVNHGLALGAVVDQGRATEGMAALAYVRADGFALSFYSDGELAFHRHKPLREEGSASDLIRRDLMLTRSFLEEAFGGTQLRSLRLLTSQAERPGWESLLVESFDHPVEAIRPEDLPLRGNAPLTDWLELAPMLGAALGVY